MVYNMKHNQQYFFQQLNVPDTFRIDNLINYFMIPINLRIIIIIQVHKLLNGVCVFSSLYLYIYMCNILFIEIID